METAILIVHVLVALAVIGLVLLQQGKGADAGASFGGGASQTVFGSQGSGSFLGRVTAALATAFFVTSLALAVIAKDKSELVRVNDGIPVVPVEQVDPALPANDAPISEQSSAAGDAPSLPSN
ncbi:preprotein translocase subunit SecG [Aestuariirhabdus litorea]|uniref:Protein-export membrane protein SecG n=1 Tax=Aestuariirhabdus litorea TaxID=2528527 RepID=A0A3P3VNR3_9GAMM|nr:preprotein translocase subunit SecG [Aestuariirhabdus litorea]RRJ83349.1 preprotein translocase subunit SecG [Aestuariirhabdus litorea]RWW93508.1 preprotein translocase subunit SecG [Endozoicomonadaceae bacterium GTF-13]